MFETGTRSKLFLGKTSVFGIKMIPDRRVTWSEIFTPEEEEEPIFTRPPFRPSIIAHDATYTKRLSPLNKKEWKAKRIPGTCSKQRGVAGGGGKTEGRRTGFITAHGWPRGMMHTPYSLVLSCVCTYVYIRTYIHTDI